MIKEIRKVSGLKTSDGSLQFGKEFVLYSCINSISLRSTYLLIEYRLVDCFEEDGTICRVQVRCRSKSDARTAFEKIVDRIKGDNDMKNNLNEWLTVRRE